MKILFYIETLRSGGKERRLVELIKGLNVYPDIEFELVLMREEIHYEEVLELGIKIHFTPKRKLKRDLSPFWMFYGIAREVKPDIIHVWGSMGAFYSIPSKLLLNLPLVNNQITSVPIEQKKPSLFNKITFYFSDLLLSNTKIGIERFMAPNYKSKCIYNGFDFERIKELADSLEVRKKYKIKTVFLVGMVASFSSKKDYDSYVEAAIKLCSIRDDITFISVGDGDFTCFKNKIPQKFEERILFMGAQKKIESIMNACDVGVLATFTEGISNTVMEFMALSKPIIVSGVGGTKEIIENDINGIHIAAKSPTLLCKKIEDLLSNVELRKTLGNNARKTIESKFEISIMVNSFIKEYKKICVV